MKLLFTLTTILFSLSTMATEHVTCVNIRPSSQTILEFSYHDDLSISNVSARYEGIGSDGRAWINEFINLKISQLNKNIGAYDLSIGWTSYTLELPPAPLAEKFKLVLEEYDYHSGEPYFHHFSCYLN